MVILSMEAFENFNFEGEVYYKLKDAEDELKLTTTRYSSKDVLKAMRISITETNNA